MRVTYVAMAGLIVLVSGLPAPADTYTWTNAGGGNWSDTGNWSGGVAASGADNTADFTTLDITAPTTVTLDAPTTIGNVAFHDKTTTYYPWTLAGSTLTMAGSGSGSTGPAITVGSTTSSTGGTATVASVIDGTNGLRKAGNYGTLILTADNTYSGGTWLSGGKLQIGNDGLTGTLGSGSVTMSGSTASLIFNRSDAIVVDNVIAGSNGTIYLRGSKADVTFTGDNTYTGTVTIDKYFYSRLTIGNGGTTGTLGGPTAKVNLAYGNLRFNRSDDIAVANVIGAGTYTSGSVSQIGGGALTLSGASIYTGGTFVDNGTLRIGVDPVGSVGAITSSAIGTGTLYLAANTTLSSDGATARTVLNAVEFNGDVTLGDATNNGELTLQGAGTLTGDRRLTVNSPVTYSGAIGSGTNSYGVTKAGSAALTLSGVNTYTGSTAVEEGTLSIGSAFLSDAANVSIAGGAYLDLNFSGADTIAALFLNGASASIGTWGGSGSGADNITSFITGSGMLNVTAVVPEPGTLAMLAGGLLGLLAYAWRKRK